MAIRDIYETPESRFEETAMAVNLGCEDETKLYGLGVHNLIDMQHTFVILSRDDLLALRDAITKELAS